MDNRQLRYCTTSDGVRIAYSADGDGPPLLACPVFVEAASLVHLSEDYQEFVRRLAEGRRLITYDVRGTGMSDRDVEDFSHEAMVRDIEAVAQAAQVSSFALLGIGISGPRAIDFASRHPEWVSHLVLYSTCARAADILAPGMATALAQMAKMNWDVAAQMLTDLQGREDAPNQNANVMRMIRQSITGPTCAAQIEALYATTDVSALLAGLKVPTLVLHRMEQQLVPAALGRRLAAEIPGAQFMPLKGDRFWIGPDESDAIFGALSEFLAPPAPMHATNSSRASLPFAGLCSVLFTDVVGHTEIMSRLGDRQGRFILREHETITRRTLEEFDGLEVKALGDGFMATFASVASAMDCAVALQRRFSERNETSTEPLYIRIGLNAGEPIQEDGDLFGAMVIVAARVAAKAGGGEILIPEPVRHLLAGKDFIFADRGETLLKGFEDLMRLYEVSWRP